MMSTGSRQRHGPCRMPPWHRRNGRDQPGTLWRPTLAGKTARRRSLKWRRPAAAISVAIAPCNPPPAALGAHIAAVVIPVIAAAPALGFRTDDGARRAADDGAGGRSTGPAGRRAADHRAGGGAAQHAEGILRGRLLSRHG